MSEFLMFGADGVYAMNNAQNQLSNLQSAFGGIGAGYGNLAGLANQQSLLNPYIGQAQQYYSQPQGFIQTLTNGVSAAPAPVKKIAKRMIERLRAEIDEWHGDVLCRFSPT